MLIMNEVIVSEIAEMSIEDRINFISDIWDSIAAIPENVQIPEWHKKELEKRIKANLENPIVAHPGPK